MKLRRVVIIIFCITAVILTGCQTNPQDPNTGLYKNLEAKQQAFASYDRVMALWDIEYTEDWVDTEYGKTHLIVCGPEEGKPLFLFPGLFADATMWYANAGALAGEYRVIAVDLPVYGGKSEPSAIKIEDITDYAAWFTSLLDHYRYESAAVAGLSYGSWISLALARELPDVISAAIMLDPSETFTKMSGIMVWQGFRYFMFFPTRDKYREFFTWIGGGFVDEKSDIWLEHMIDVIDCGTVGMMDVPQHRVYEPEELEMVDMPVLILSGGKPIIYSNPEAFAQAAGEALPGAEIEVIADTGHSLNVEKPEVVNNKILSFLHRVYN